jgi:hypothetical protein
VLRAIFAGTQEPPSLKILGIAWNYVKDKMYFDFTTLMSPKMLLNKMELLRILHSLYDPMGILIPFTITGKLALQMCSRQGLTWKAKLPDDIREAWDPWMAQVQELNGYSFIRTIIPGEQPNKTNKQIHVFADASKDAYAAVAYMRCESNGKATVRFIHAKLRVRPVKAAHTIPRMELLAIELGLQLVKKIYKTFKIETNSLYIWTDSRACHDWLRIEARALQVFIKNRVLKVRQFLKLKQVKWVPGVLNPADSATRGISAAQLRMDKHWLQGPDFLQGHQDTWPDQPEPPGELIADLLPATTQGMKLKKKKSEKILIMATCLVNLQPLTDHYYEPMIPNISKYSRWRVLVRIIATCLWWK